MKETGIIMSGNHPGLILDGTKTMTRRVIKPQPPCWAKEGAMNQFGRWDFAGEAKLSCGYNCPYGQVGDRLWVRETFMFNKGADVRESWVGTEYEAVLGEPPHYLYRADDTDEVHRQEKWFKWRPSLFMPRKASRILLEITEVRAERLQEITIEDVLAEGISQDAVYAGDAFLHFGNLWNRLNAKKGYGWDTNPWVWVIGFKGLPQ